MRFRCGIRNCSVVRTCFNGCNVFNEWGTLNCGEKVRRAEKVSNVYIVESGVQRTPRDRAVKTKLKILEQREKG